jgi:hypothetical protein
LTFDRQIKAVIGMSRDKFDQLNPVFTASHATIQRERLQNKEIKNCPGGTKIRLRIRLRSNSPLPSST